MRGNWEPKCKSGQGWSGGNWLTKKIELKVSTNMKFIPLELLSRR